MHFVNSLSFVVAADNCLVSVNKCEFAKDSVALPAYAVAIEIRMMTKLAVANSKFEGRYGVGLEVLTAEDNSDAHFVNCTFFRVSGIRASNQTNILIESSIVLNSINTLQKGLIQASDRSTLRFSNSNITDVKIVETSNVILVQSQSSVTFFNCLYSRNIMAQHIVLMQDCALEMTGTHVLSNTIDGSYSGHALGGIIVTLKTDFLFEQKQTHINGSTVTIQGSIFENNTVESFRRWHVVIVNEFSVIQLRSSRQVNILDSTFTNNILGDTIQMTGMSRSPGNFLRISNCSFYTKYSSYAHVQTLADVVIYNSTFVTSHSSSSGFVTQGISTVRVWNSTFGSPQLERHQQMLYS